MKAEGEDLMIRLPMLKADQECAKKTRDHIEAERVKLIEQFIQHFSNLLQETCQLYVKMNEYLVLHWLPPVGNSDRNV